jgi:hypothetical protein
VNGNPIAGSSSLDRDRGSRVGARVLGLPAADRPRAEPIAPTVVPAARKRPTPAREAARTYRIPWADLLAKVFEIDVLACPECGGRMMLSAFIAEPTVAKRILDHLRLDSTGPPFAPARGGQPDSVDPRPPTTSIFPSSPASSRRPGGVDGPANCL